MILTIVLNCANEPVNVPVFEAAHVPETLVKYVQHPILDVVILSKLTLGFLIPILTNEQCALLKLTHAEAEHLVLDFSKSIDSSDLRTDNHSVVEHLTFFLNFTKQFGAVVLQDDDSQQKRKDSNFLINYKQRMDISASNIHILVNLNIVKFLDMLITTATVDSIVIEKSFQLLWNFLHDEAIVKLISSLVSGILASVHFEASAHSKSLILCIQCLLGDANKSGK